MKFYTVWIGVLPGVYNSWAEAEVQVKHFKGARYKMFKNQADAEYAFKKHTWQDFYTTPPQGQKNKIEQDQVPGQVPTFVAHQTNSEEEASTIPEHNYGLAPGEPPW